MSIASRYNKGSKFVNVPNTENFETIKASEACKKYSKPILIHALYISSGNYHYPMAITENEFIMLPPYIAPTITEILKDEEAIAEINAGMCGIQFAEYEKDGKTNISVEFVDFSKTFVS